MRGCRWRAVLLAGLSSAVLGVSGCSDDEGSEDGASPGPGSAQPDHQLTMQTGTQTTVDGMDIRPSIVSMDGDATVYVVDQESQTPDAEGNTEPDGEVLSGREGDEFEAYGYTFTFVEVNPDPVAGTVVIAVDESESD
ncbi:hypothetical protein F4561_001981 [Lipingzhangella halophila]|uniref:Uncharacterized protein n=1 Tax=Lipingzhangella halophila TaxID=1783352 RepID=A0A7W7RFR0_9ACTN|nr:hypothetical protein [Lipingzhangella halophila]MBB4931161.1 hypothetical protein [Lipingzhangella halophila]